MQLLTLIIYKIIRYSYVTTNMFVSFSFDNTGHIVEITFCNHDQIIFYLNDNSHVIMRRITKHTIKYDDISSSRNCTAWLISNTIIG